MVNTHAVPDQLSRHKEQLAHHARRLSAKNATAMANEMLIKLANSYAIEAKYREMPGK
jgi:hypothetical protein